MGGKRRRRKDSSFTPAIIVINVLIIGVIALMIFFIYRFITSEEMEPPARTTPVPRTVSVTRQTVTAPQSEETTTTITTEEYVSMTKASTTTPASVTAPNDEIGADIKITVNAQYEQNFFIDDLFIGDSIMTGFSGFGYLPAENVFAKVGLNPESVFKADVDGFTAIEKIKLKQPKRIFIMLGTNGLAFMTGEYMAGELDKFITEAENASPDSEIILMTIPPVTANHEAVGNETMEAISSYNSLLKELSVKKNIIMADVCELLTDSSGYLSDKYAEQDGLHFLGAAYKAVLSYLQEMAE